LVKQAARFNLENLEQYDLVVTGCASCTLMLKDYPKLFQGQAEFEAAERLVPKVKHISEVIAERQAAPVDDYAAPTARMVTYHSSCHLRAAGVSKAPRQVLSRLPGVRYVEMQDSERCAGGAGTFILKDYETSQKIFQRKRRCIDESGADVVVTSCPACMIQLNNGLRGKVVVKHLAEFVRDAWEKKERDQAGPGQTIEP
jgi:Fe-S oxidoreductase